MAKNENRFIFKGYEIQKKTHAIQFNYSLLKGNTKITFSEKLILPRGFGSYEKLPCTVVSNILDSLSLILGISYWKTYCPSNIILESQELTQEQAEFWNTLYTKGLGEFFYKNKIDYRGLVQFPYKKSLQKQIAPRLTGKKTSLLMFGGGKDSLVSAELLKKQKKSFLLFTLNQHTIQEDTAALVRKKIIVITRIIDPKLFLLNRKGVYNGHVPATAIYSFVTLLGALLYDYRAIVASSEKSADFGNIEYLGSMINHQWSKSQEFEILFQNYIKRYISPSIIYYSPLRSYTELEIIKQFTRYKKYFLLFSSCNANFSITKPTIKKWCGQCAKCAFMFAALAAYLPKLTVMDIFKKNLFADASLIPMYQELLGMRKFKPFECVGTPEETQRAFSLILTRGEFADDTVIKRLSI